MMRALPLRVPLFKMGHRWGCSRCPPLLLGHDVRPRVEAISDKTGDGPLGNERSPGPLSTFKTLMFGDKNHSETWSAATYSLDSEVAYVLCTQVLVPTLALVVVTVGHFWPSLGEPDKDEACDSLGRPCIRDYCCTSTSRPGVWLPINKFILAFLQPSMMLPFPGQNITLRPRIVAIIAFLGGHQLPFLLSRSTTGFH